MNIRLLRTIAWTTAPTIVRVIASKNNIVIIITQPRKISAWETVPAHAGSTRVLFFFFTAAIRTASTVTAGVCAATAAAAGAVTAFLADSLAFIISR